MLGAASSQYANLVRACELCLQRDDVPDRAFRLLLPMFAAVHEGRPNEVWELGARVLERWPTTDAPWRAEVLAVLASAAAIAGRFDDVVGPPRPSSTIPPRAPSPSPWPIGRGGSPPGRSTRPTPPGTSSWPGSPPSAPGSRRWRSRSPRSGPASSTWPARPTRRSSCSPACSPPVTRPTTCSSACSPTYLVPHPAARR